MRTERLYLHDIIEAADAITRFVRGLDQQTFIQDGLVYSAVAYQLMIIGEAAAHVSDGTRSLDLGIEWQDIVAFRNIIVHAYFATDESIMWNAATRNVPQLRAQIQALLARLDPPS